MTLEAPYIWDTYTAGPDSVCFAIMTISTLCMRNWYHQRPRNRAHRYPVQNGPPLSLSTVSISTELSRDQQRVDG